MSRANEPATCPKNPGLPIVAWSGRRCSFHVLSVYVRWSGLRSSSSNGFVKQDSRANVAQHAATVKVTIDPTWKPVLWVLIFVKCRRLRQWGRLCQNGTRV